MGAVNVEDRIASSLGGLGPVSPQLQSNIDIMNGGVLFALPALLLNGLLDQTEKYFQLPNGYYGAYSIFLLLAFAALARYKSIEALRHVPPGEWGKLIGLDRIPEARTLREKIDLLTQNNQSKEWGANLCKQWMVNTPTDATTIYVDGHVRVYNGSQTNLPRHYVAREKLCARGVCDYWVNAKDGQPFFYISKPVDPGLVKVLENDIVPELERLIPNQPSQEELQAHPKKHRFTLIFDRAGFSTEFMARMAKKRIACMTYTKKQGGDWDPGEFLPYTMTLQSGEKIECKMAERGLLKYGIDKKPLIWVREIRRIKKNNSQGSMTSTNYEIDLVKSYIDMVSRWSQENFFSYMRHQFNIDRLIDYSLSDLDDTTNVINPKWRSLDSEIRKQQGILNRKISEFGALTLDCNIDAKEFTEKQDQKSKILEEIEELENLIKEKKIERKKNPKRICYSDLPEETKFKQPRPQAKHFIDTIKMIAYRAETCMLNTIREKMPGATWDSSRSVIRGIYASSADFEVNQSDKTLTVRLHHRANDRDDELIRFLCNELTDTETIYPGTDLRLIYKMVSD